MLYLLFIREAEWPSRAFEPAAPQMGTKFAMRVGVGVIN
jgi:hypothetical protein